MQRTRGMNCAQPLSRFVVTKEDKCHEMQLHMYVMRNADHSPSAFYAIFPGKILQPIATLCMALKMHTYYRHSGFSK